jgi:hypothetical protein
MLVAAAGAVEVAGWFVGQNQRGFVHQSASDRHALLLPAGELRGLVAQPASQADALQRLSGTRFALFLRHRRVQHGKHYIVDGGRSGQSVESLKHKPDALVSNRRQLVVPHGRDVLAFEVDRSRLRFVQVADHVHEGRLPRPRGAHHRHELAALHAYGHAVQGVYRNFAEVVAIAKVARFDHIDDGTVYQLRPPPKAGPKAPVGRLALLLRISAVITWSPAFKSPCVISTLLPSE